MARIQGFKPVDPKNPLEPEALRKEGFVPNDVICWSDGKGTLLFQNGDEFVSIVPKT